MRDNAHLSNAIADVEAHQTSFETRITQQVISIENLNSSMEAEAIQAEHIGIQIS